MADLKKLYVMISKTDTGVGSLIRTITQFPYNHVSMTLDPTFRTWVSFARFIQDTPLYGGYLKEPVERFLAKGQQVDVHIFGLELTPKRYQELQELFSKAGKLDSGYIYNYLELLTLSIGIPFPVRNAYSCLGFANFVMGTNYRSIRDLDRDMTCKRIYEGTLNALVPDSKDRSDIYFTRLGLWNGLIRTTQTLSELFRRAFSPNHPGIPTA